MLSSAGSFQSNIGIPADWRHINHVAHILKRIHEPNGSHSSSKNPAELALKVSQQVQWLYNSDGVLYASSLG